MNALDPFTVPWPWPEEPIDAGPLTDADLRRMADEYQREAIDTAQSEAAMIALQKEFRA